MIIEATGHILGAFNSSLVQYVEKLFQSRNIQVLTGTVVHKVEANVATLSEGDKVKFGLMVWSTGIKQTLLIEQLPKGAADKHTRGGRLKIDGLLRVLQDGKPVHDGTIFAMGDCAGDSQKPLPALAQVASQQGSYLARTLNRHGLEATSKAKVDDSDVKTFKYEHLGSLASVGEWKGVYDSPSFGFDGEEDHGPPIRGILAFLLWRSAYWTKQVSLVNKMLIPMYWFKTMLFGRDISRF